MISYIKPPKPNTEVFNKFLADSIEQNHYTNFGINHNRLKNKFIEMTNIEEVVLVTNATVALDGLHNILSTKCGVAFLPSFTFPATNQGCNVSTIMSNTRSGGSDIGRAYWDITADGDTYSVTVNPFGCINKPCEKPKTKYWIVDNAAGLVQQTKEWFNNGADAVVYSLHATKILSACEGGVVFFKNKDLYQEYSEYINFGYKTQPDGNRIAGIKGSNHKMSELNAAWCLMNLETVDEDIKARTHIMNQYKEFCENNSIPYIPSLQGFWLLGKELATKIQKFAFERKIDVRPYYQALPLTNNKCRVTNLFNENGICLPTRATLEKDEVSRIIYMLHEAKVENLI